MATKEKDEKKAAEEQAKKLEVEAEVESEATPSPAAGEAEQVEETNNAEEIAEKNESANESANNAEEPIEEDEDLDDFSLDEEDYENILFDDEEDEEGTNISSEEELTEEEKVIFEEIKNELEAESEEENEFSDEEANYEEPLSDSTNQKKKKRRPMSFGKRETSDDLKQSELRTLMAYNITKRVSLYATLIQVGERVKRSDDGSSRRTEIVAIFKPDKPFDSFTIEVPFIDMFTEDEIKFIKARNSHLKEKGEKYKERSALLMFIGGKTTIEPTKMSKRRMLCQGSRKLALARKERIYFERGVMKAQGREKVQKGDIIRSCNIFFVSKLYIRVDVCGIPTRIGIRELSYLPQSSAKDIFSKGDTVDVKIKDIKIVQNHRYLTCSVKECLPNPLIGPFNEDKNHLGIEGRTSGTIMYVIEKPNSIQYVVYSDRGWACRAISQKVQTNEKITRLKAGTRVIVEPFEAHTKSAMFIGKITDVISKKSNS